MDQFRPDEPPGPTGTVATDSRVWREQLLHLLIRSVFILGATVAVPSMAYAAIIGAWPIVVVDAMALVAVAAISFSKGLTYRARAVSFLAVTYALGVFLFLAVGPIAGSYLMAVPVLAAVLLGTRPAVIGLVINGLTMLAFGLVPRIEPLVDDSELESLGSWLTVSLNFMLVNAVITLSCAVILARLESSLSTNRALAVAVEQSPDAILIAEPDGTITYRNSTALSYAHHGLDSEATTLPELFANADHPYPTTLPAEGWNSTLEAVPPEVPQRLTYVLTVREVQNEGRSQLIAIVRDVSAERAMQDEIARSQKLQALGTLVGGTAHDFNNALGSVVGLAELLRAEVSDPALQAMVDDILRASARAQSVVRQLSVFGQTSRPDHVASDISLTLTEDLPLLQANVPDHLRIELDADPGVFGSIEPGELHQVVANLVLNAAHAMSDRSGGTITITVRSIPTDSAPFTLEERSRIGPSAAYIAVTDTGHGIDPSVLPRVFDPFFTTKSPEHGTGLGLASVHGTVSAVRGHITIDSVVGTGTTVHVYLPVTPVPAAPVGLPPAEGDPSEHGTDPVERACHVLMVDDEQLIVSSMSRLLVRRGLTVTATDDPHHAIELIEQGMPFDLLLTDVSMPAMSGIDLVRVARRHRPDLPVVVMSGYGDSVDAGDRAELGLDHMIGKPFTIDDLLALIDRALRPNG